MAFAVKIGTAAAYALFLAFWMTLCARVKLGRWWENSVCCWLLRLCRRVLRWCWRVLCRAWGALAGFVRGIPLVWRTAVGCCVIGVLLFALESNHADGLLLMLIALLSVAACLLSMQLRRLQKGGEALAAGDLTSQVDTSHMYFDLKRHGENLNAISRGMSIAVEQKLKSERLKTELITNVSHDIKTPLTSIVNYVDLLQREHTPEQEREYLAVLDRQAHKLKKLTVDLVEMSKASTGNIPCHIARRSVRELIDQTVGEYAEKLSAARLEPVVTLPDEDLYCLCDGALLAQSGRPDMCTPIARALAYPGRIASTVEPLDLTSCPTMSFERPDFKRYPCLKLAIEASRSGQGMTTALNAANEVAVDAFLKGAVSYPDIARIVAAVLGRFGEPSVYSLDEILAADARARALAREELKKI